jgi:type 1 glutamine amidotransferase
VVHDSATVSRLYAAGEIRADVAQAYPDVRAIEAGDLLVSYTSQVPATDEQCFALRRYLEHGGRWFALHASNSVRDNPYLPGILGSRFITHPPYLHYAVSITRPDEPLLDGIAPFEVVDEMYVTEQRRRHRRVAPLALGWRGGGSSLRRGGPAIDVPSASG